MKKIFLIAICACLAVFANAQHSGMHHIWDGLLQKHVSAEGIVDYSGFQKDIASVEKYCNSLGVNPPRAGWSSDEEKAYWLNTYNAYTVLLIIENYPLKSIKDIPQPWDQELINISGDTMTLNHIEHEILRKKFKDPRIHVGVNCASVGCPKLHNRAFTSKNVDSLLDKLMSDFINDGIRNQIYSGEMRLSMIFNWFAGDFTKDGTLVEYVNKYSKKKAKPDAFISYLDYNWQLNE